MTQVWFTADTHFGHRNIIKYCQRPYGSVEAMDHALIENWNDTVGVDDVIIHLGDIVFTGTMKERLPLLNGHKLLIYGNHDHKRKRGKVLEHAKVLQGNKVYDIQGHKVWMDHYPPYQNRTKIEDDVLYLAGHQHNPHPIQPDWIDVGVDAWNYRPVNFNELLNIHRRMD